MRPQRGDPDFVLGVQPGAKYLDQTLGYIVLSDGNGLWRNPATGVRGLTPMTQERLDELMAAITKAILRELLKRGYVLPPPTKH